MRVLHILCFLLITLNLAAKEDSISLTQSLNKLAINDTARFSIYDQLIKETYSKPAVARIYCVKAMELAKRTGNRKKEAWYQRRAGNFHLFTSNFLFALEDFTAAFNIYSSLGDSSGMTSCLNGMGIVYGEKYQMTGTEKDLDNSILYITQAFGNFKRLGDVGGIRICMNNLATKYTLKKNYSGAIAFLSSNLKYYSDTLDHNGISLSLINMADAYYQRGQVEWSQRDLDSARYLLEEVIYRGQDKNMGRISEALFLLAKLKISSKRAHEAIPLLEQCIGYYRRNAQLLELSNAYRELAKAYEMRGDVENAFLYQKRFSEVRDSAIDLANQNSINNLQATFELNRQEKELDLLEKEKNISDLELSNVRSKSQRQQLIIWSVIGILVLAASLIFIIYRSSRRRKQLNAELHDLNESIRRKNEQITDSITYARGIQETILKGKGILETNFKESFILYMPKDIVGGDFYWIRQIGNKVFVAAVDCTGHGIPGAFTSLIAHRHLEHALAVLDEKSPGLILDKLNEMVLESFAGSDDSSLVKTGLDISLIAYGLKSGQLSFSGAHLGALIVHEGMVSRMEGEKLPVGHRLEEKFPTAIRKMESGSMIYLYTDGFKDQKQGAPPFKKMGKDHFEKALVAVASYPASEQEAKLLQVFEEWRGMNEQMDDVLVMGLRI